MTCVPFSHLYFKDQTDYDVAINVSSRVTINKQRTFAMSAWVQQRCLFLPCAWDRGVPWMLITPKGTGVLVWHPTSRTGMLCSPLLMALVRVNVYSLWHIQLLTEPFSMQCVLFRVCERDQREGNESEVGKSEWLGERTEIHPQITPVSQN